MAKSKEKNKSNDQVSARSGEANAKKKRNKFPNRVRTRAWSDGKPPPFPGVECTPFFNKNRYYYQQQQEQLQQQHRPNFYKRKFNKKKANANKKNFTKVNNPANEHDKNALPCQSSPTKSHFDHRNPQHVYEQFKQGLANSSKNSSLMNNIPKKLSSMNANSPKKLSSMNDNSPKNSSSMNDNIPKNLSSMNDNTSNEVNEMNSSKQCRSKQLSWLLHPFKDHTFFSKFWEKTPMLIARNNTNYYKRTINLSTIVVDQVLAKNELFFTRHIDVTSYVDGVRETHNPEGRALPHIVWDLYRNGCSIRFLNPQAFVPCIHRLNSDLQETFGFVGSNLYLTPAGSQGFAPHYDDIEAFVLQIEGSKHWKVYQPLSEAEKLPRYSSKNMTEAELGPPIIDCVLRPGDLLYFPRGFIHQARTTDEHSLHITLSAYQCTAFVDIFEMVLPNAIKEAAKNTIELREGLPLNYEHVCGITRHPKYSKEREQVCLKIKKMLHDFVENLDLDSAVDAFSAHKLHDDLPPYLSDDVKNCTVHGNRNTIDSDGRVTEVIQLQLDSKVCLLQLNICRLVEENGRFLLYHSVSNSLEYHERDREFLEVPKESIEAVKFLFHSYPKHVKVADLPIADDEGKWSFANTLWENGLLRTDKPLNKINPEELNSEDCDDDDDDDAIIIDEVSDAENSG